MFQKVSEHPQCRIRGVDEGRLCGLSLPIESIAYSPWVGVGRLGKIPAMPLLGFEPGPPRLKSAMLTTTPRGLVCVCVCVLVYGCILSDWDPEVSQTEVRDANH